MIEHPKIIYNVSQSQLSIARHYGGINYNGVYYKYNPIDDTLNRVDPVVKPKRKSRINHLQSPQ